MVYKVLKVLNNPKFRKIEKSKREDEIEPKKEDEIEMKRKDKIGYFFWSFNLPVHSDYFCLSI
ncbi:MAG TPA: hypothetical protein VN414_11810 [Methanosarcina sp.]|nr:hypothetical protein [Methanosarcina sp.]